MNFAENLNFHVKLVKLKSSQEFGELTELWSQYTDFSSQCSYLKSVFYTPEWNLGASSFCPICLWLCGKKTLNLAITINHKRDFISRMHNQLK